MADAVAKLITNSIHTAFIKYPEGDGDENMDYDWISPGAKFAHNQGHPLGLGFEIVKKDAA